MFKIKIGEFTTEIKLSPKQLERDVQNVFSGFISTERPDTFLEARLVSDLKYDDYNELAPAKKVAPDMYKIKWYYFSGTFYLKKGYAKAIVNSKPYVLSSLLRIIYAIKATNSDGLFIHAASFVKQGDAYLFVGKSGSGKSTLLKMAMNSDQSIRPLTDEISYVALEGGRPFAYSTPFWGNTKIKGQYIKAPLKKLYFIRQSKRDFVKKISIDGVMINMLENVLFASTERESLDSVLSTIRGIVKKVEGFNLYFTKSDKFLEVI
ncbi:MAG: hypothetical protein N2746_07510 [Deltaproteobacteria bacterium]|nr:hypothetical protein [Deltaproteobacteria bacterium]